MKRFLVVICVGALIGAGLAAFWPGSPDAAFHQSGYFKDGLNNRVLAIVAPGPVPEPEARAAMMREPWTAGQFTVVFLYPPGSGAPSDALTLAGDFQAAMGVALDSYPGWSWQLTRSPNGQVSLVAGAAR